MAEFSSSPEARALARLKELHRAEQAPPGFRVLVGERLARLEASAPKRGLPRRGGIGLLLLAAAAAVSFALRSERTRLTPQAEPPAATGATTATPAAAPPGHTGDLKAGRIVVSGSLAPDAIRQVMRAEFARFRECYDSLPRPRPVVVSTLSFTIGAAGDVTAGGVESDASPALGQCLERVLFAMRFPAPRGGVVTVSFPMQFGP
jgi:hypothetical protein